MTIVKKVRDIKIGDEDYIMTFDMRSIAVFKELTGKSFLQSSAKLGLLDDEVVLGFIGATLRKVNEENKPLGKQVYNMDIMYLLLNLSEIVIELVTSSLSQSKNNDNNIKKVIDEDIDLDFLLYCYTSILNKSENEFWESTPRKIFLQIDIYNKLNGKESTKDKINNIVQGETLTLKAVD